MRHLKKYESIGDDLQIGDYVLMKSKTGDEELADLINNTIGQIIDIDNYYHEIKVEYKFPKNILSNWNIENVRIFSISQIIASSTNKKKLKLLAQTNKYNL